MQQPLYAFVFVPETSNYGQKIYGLSILERTLFALQRSEVTKVFLPKTAEANAAKIIDKNKDLKLAVEYCPSFLEAAAELGGNGCLVLSQPLVIDQKIPRELAKNGQKSGSVMGDSTGNILWLPPAKLQVLAGALSSFEDLKSALKSNTFPIETIDDKGLICEAVTNSKEKRQVESALIRSLTKPTDGWVSRNLNRPISTIFSRVLAHTGVTPNQFTIVTGMIGLSTAYFLVKGGYWNYLIGGALFHFTSILDGVDGELARLKFKSSPFGQWLDTVSDNLSYLAALGGIIAGIYINGASEFVKTAGVLAVVFAVLALGSLYFYLLRFKSGGTLLNVKYGFQDGKGNMDKFIEIAGAFGKRDLFALIFFIMAIFGKMPWALVYIAIMAFFVFAFSIQAHLIAARQAKD